MRLAGMLACATLAGCVTAAQSRIASYGAGFEDARVYVGERLFKVKFHPAEPVVKIERGLGGGLNMAVQGAGLDPRPMWIAAANAVLEPLGCRATDAYGLDTSMTYEARYSCSTPGPVSREDIAARRAAWREGIRIASPL